MTSRAGVRTYNCRIQNNTARRPVTASQLQIYHRRRIRFNYTCMETIRVKVGMTVAVSASVVLHCTIMKRKGTSWATGWMDSVSRTGQAESTPLYLNTITEKILTLQWPPARC